MNSQRILVVDDDPNLRWVLQTQLEQMGYAVSAAADGAGAIEAIEKEPPALVLTDLKMPGMDGMTLLRELHDRRISVAAIVLTGFATRLSPGW